MRTDMMLGLRLVLGNSRLRLIVMCTGLQNLGFGGMIIALLLLFGVRTLHLSPVVLGLVIAAGSVGALTAAAAARRIIERFGLGRSLAAAVAGASLVTLLIPLATPADAAPLLVIALAGASFGGVLYNVGQVTLRQAITPPHQLGRMNATIRFLVWGMIPIGAALAGVLGATIGLRPTIWAGAVIALTAVIPVLRRPLLSLTGIPEPAAQAVTRPGDT
jgi:MFS family permease